MKKGDGTMTAIVGIILVIAAFLIITTVVTLFYREIPDKDAATACRATNVLRGHAKIDISGGPVKFQQSGIPSACKTVDVEVSGNRGKVMLQMADYIADCWWQWANGRFNSLLCEEKGFEPAASCDESSCFACYFVYIDAMKDRDTQQDTTFTATDLREFMRTTTRYVEDADTGEIADQDSENTVDVSYLDYIQYDDRGLMFFHDNLKNEKDFIFAPGKFYAIFYFEPHEDDWFEGDDSNADELKNKRAIYIEEKEFVDESKACAVKHGYEGE